MEDNMEAKRLLRFADFSGLPSEHIESELIEQWSWVRARRNSVCALFVCSADELLRAQDERNRPPQPLQ
jgi:hypothetical protein